MFQVALLDANKKLNRRLGDKQLDAFAVIGGFAVSRWGRPRATGDIDFAVKVSSPTLAQLADSLGGTFRAGDISDPLLGSVSFSVSTKSGDIPIQLLQFPEAWEKVIFKDLDLTEIDGEKIPFIDWKGLVLLKLYAGSALDLEDARAVIDSIKVKPSDRRYLEVRAGALRMSRRLELVKSW